MNIMDSDIISVVGFLMCLFGGYIGGMIAALIGLVTGGKDYSAMQDCIMRMRGYRSKMSKKNLDTWNFAQHYSTVCFMKVLTIVFLALILVTIFLFVTGVMYYEGTIYIVISSLFFLPLIIVRILTEKALKKNFNKDGTKGFI